MCGIVGMAGSIGIKEEKVFRNLLVFDTVRGEHSTGVAAVHADGDISVSKVVGDPFTLFDSRGFESIMRRPNRVFIGHNRFATTGKVNRKNAHPFEFDNVVGVHNGTLTNKFDIPGTQHLEVDSEAIYHHINKEGVENTIPLLKGAWALVWFDKEKGSVNLIRNKERTLYYSYSKDGKTLFWASEAWMLNVALSRNDIQFETPKLLDVDVHHEWGVDLKGSVLDVVCKPLKGKEEVAFVQGKKFETYGTTTSGGTSNQIDLIYFGSEQTFEMVCKGRDTEGGEFFLLEDVIDKSKDVRLYFTGKKYDGKEGWRFKGKVSGVKKGSNGKYFYKVTTVGPFYFTKEKEKEVNLNCSWCDKLLKYESQIVRGKDASNCFCTECANSDDIKELGII